MSITYSMAQYDVTKSPEHDTGRMLYICVLSEP